MANDSAMVLLLLVGVMFTSPSHSAHVAHNPYFKPYFYENPGAYQQPRILTFDLNDYSSIRMRTTTSVTSTTLTFTTTATCTRSTNVACVTDAPATTNRAPFLAGFARSLKEAKVELSEPFQVASVEPTVVPKDEPSRETRSFGSSLFIGPYEMYQLESSFARQLPSQPSADQARLFSISFTTSTLTLTSFFSTTSVVTRTLIPTCSTSGYFTQCT